MGIIKIENLDLTCGTNCSELEETQFSTNMYINEPIVDKPVVDKPSTNKRIINWNELSKLGLIYKINSEILHPHGLAIFRDDETGVSGGAIVGDEPYTYSEDSIKKNTEKLNNLEDNIIELRKNINKNVSEDTLEYDRFYDDALELFKLWKQQEQTSQNVQSDLNVTSYSIYRCINYIKDKYNKNNNTVGILDDPLVFPNLFENPSLETSLDFINILINETINVLQNVQKHKMINFEGIDASGKETISTLFEEIINEFFSLSETLFYIMMKFIGLGKIKNLCKIDKNGKNHTLDILKHFKDNFQTRKTNIPNYDNDTGKQIKSLLHANDSLSNIQPLKFLFAINRLETQNYINGLVKRKNSLEYFDRWVDSSVAFTLAKFMYNEKIELNLIEKTKHLQEEIYNLEYNTLNLKIPDLTILCTAPIETIGARLKKRSEKQALDTHEQNLDFLNFVQLTYKAIFGLPLGFKDEKDSNHDLESHFKYLIAPNKYRPKIVIQLDTSNGTPEECVKRILENL